MKNNPHQVDAKDILSSFSKAIETVQDYVSNKYFSFLNFQEWELPETFFVSKLTKKLHGLFSISKNFSLLNMVLPASLAVSICLFVSYFFHWLFPYFFYQGRLIMLGQVHLSFGEITRFFLLASLFMFATVFSAAGVYWQIYEIAINKKISPTIKIVLSLLIALFVYFFIFEKKVYQMMNLISQMEGVEIGLKEFLININHNMWVLLLSLVFIYIPIVLFYAIFFSKMIIFGLVFAGRLLQWLFLVQITQPQRRFNEFLATPLPLFDQEYPKTFLEIENSKISAIKNWINIRRQTIQNRLIPASLGVAFLGILASTSFGENVLGLISNIMSNYFLALPNLAETGEYNIWFISFAKLLGLMVVILLLVGPLSLLLRESVILDFILEACALAESIKIIQAEENKIESVDKTDVSWFDVIKKLFGKF